MGVEILSFTIKDIEDDVQYLASLGKAQIARIKRDATVGVAEANRDAAIMEAKYEKKFMNVKYATDTKIQDNSRAYELHKAHFDQEVNAAKAQTSLAYDLQAAKIQQNIRSEEMEIDVVERRKEIEIESHEIERKDRELKATIELPADAENYRIQQIAEGERTQVIETATAEAERIKKIGTAEATAIEMVGIADAERMRMKANVYRNFQDAAIMNIALEALPKIAAEIAAPLAKTGNIVLISGSDQDGHIDDVNPPVDKCKPSRWRSLNALNAFNLFPTLHKKH